MPTYTWNATNPGQFVDWNTPGDWLPQIVPNGPDADVVIPEITTQGGDPYNFFVTLAGDESYLVHSLTLTDQTLQLLGTLAVGADLAMGPGSEIDISGSLAIGSLSNAGAIDIQGSGRISSTASIDNQGEIIGQKLTLDFAGLHNAGTLIATGSLEVDVSSTPGAFDNFSDGTLSGGTYEAITGGALTLHVGAITTDAATLVLSGSPGGGTSTIAMQTGDTEVSLTQTLQTIAPTGVLEVRNQGFAAAAALTVAGLVTLDSGTLSAPGLTIAAGGTVAGGGTIAGAVTNDGVIAAGQATSDLNASGDSTLVLGGSVDGTGSISILALGSNNGITGLVPNQVELSSASGNPVAFGDWNGVLVLDSPTLFTGPISGFTTGFDRVPGGLGGPATIEHSDAIVLAGLTASAITDIGYTGTSASGTLHFSDAGTSVSLDFVGDYSVGDFVFAAGPQALSTSPPSVVITEVLPCFLAGTKLLTERGPVAVEQLAVGDRLLTPVSGGSAPVCWIGQRRIDATRHPRPQDVWPIRVRADAFGLGRPHCDLLLSPDHAVHVDGVLIPVRHLVNGVTVVRTRAAAVHYFHVELPRHDIVLAEGLPTESYLDLGNRAAFGGGGALVLHPDFGRRVWEREGCAELILGGPALARVRARLAVQALLLVPPVRRSAANRA